jgi:hypothetical protein
LRNTPFFINMAFMYRFSTAFLALMLVLSNIVMAADIHAEAMNGQHHPQMELHDDDGCGGENGDHPQCHHCCHAQGHFSSLPQRSYSDLRITAHDWALTEITHPHSLGYAPPVPPPKA